MERRHSTTSDSSTDSRQSICEGLDGTSGRVAKVTTPKVAANPLQFVKVGPCDLYRQAQEQLKKVEEIKKAKKEHKDEVEDWQSNLDNWKCSRRKRQEHIIERVVEVKKFEIEEQERNRRRSKTFNEMLQERNTRGRLPSLPIYHNDEEDLADLGLGCNAEDSDDLAPSDSNAVFDEAEDIEPDQSGMKAASSKNTDIAAVDSSNSQNEEYTYERAIQSYVNFTETRVKSRSLKEINEAKTDRNTKISPPIPAKPSHLTLNRTDKLFMNTKTELTSSTKTEPSSPSKKVVVPKVDVNRRRELFEKIKDSEESIKAHKLISEVPAIKSIKERMSSLGKQTVLESQKECKNGVATGGEKLIKERLQTIQTMAVVKQPSKKNTEPISSVTLKDRLSSFAKPDSNSAKKQPVIEPSVSIKERLNNLQTSINKEPTKTVVSSPSCDFNEKLATFRESSSKSDLYDSDKKDTFNSRPHSPSSDVSSSRRHFRHRSLDSLDVDQENAGSVGFDRVQSLEDLDYCRNYPPSTFSGDTDREDSGIHTADVSSSVSQADDYDLHILTNTLDDMKIAHQSATVDDKHGRLQDCSTYPADDFQKADSVSAMPEDTKLLHNTVEDSSFNFNKSFNNPEHSSSQTLPSIPESSFELTLNTIIQVDSANVNNNLANDDNHSSQCNSSEGNTDTQVSVDRESCSNHYNLTEDNVNKFDEATYNGDTFNEIQLHSTNNNEDSHDTRDYAINTFLDFNHSKNDLLNSDASPSVNMIEKFDDNSCDLYNIQKSVAANDRDIITLNKEFISNEKLQEELQFNGPLFEAKIEHGCNYKTESNADVLDQLDSGDFVSSGCDSAEDNQMDLIVMNLALKQDNNEVFTFSPAVLEPPKEKPPPPPLENSDEEIETKPKKTSSVWRVDSTKRIKKEIRQKRSSFLGIEGGNDDSYLEPELELIKPPDISALLEEERRMERQLYRQSVCSESDSNQESRDSGVELDHKHHDSVWSHSRNDSETYGNQSTTSDEDEIMKKEREIIETLEKEEKIRKQDLGEKLAMRLRELEAEKERLEWEQLNKENSLSKHTRNLYPEQPIHQRTQGSVGGDLTKIEHNNYDQDMNIIQADWYDQRSSLQDITQKGAELKAIKYHDDNQYRIECRKSLQDLTRTISSGNHLPKSKQNLHHRRSMPNLQEAAPRRPPPPPPIITANHHISHNEFNDMGNHHSSAQMKKQTLHALSAAPRSRLISNETWQAKRKHRPDNYNYQHWLIQEAEHRRITEQQQRQSVASRRPIPSQHAYITPTSQLANQQQYTNSHWSSKSQNHDMRTPQQFSTAAWTNNHPEPGNHQHLQKSKPLPDSIIQTLTQRVHNKFNPDSNNNRRRKEIFSNNVLPPPTYQNDCAKDKMLSVSGKKRCSHCGEELGRGAAMIIESLQLFYHIDCFKCCVCCLQLGDGLMGTDVRVRNNKLHCHNCYSSDDGAKFSCV